MNNTDIDYNLLVHETLTQAINSDEAREFRREFLFQEIDKQENILESSDSEALPDSPGLVYRIKKETFSFAVECLSGSSIKELIKDAEMDRASGDLEWNYFETPYKELADYIREQIAHRRFSSQELNLFNISDPSPSWWMRDEGNKFTLYFSVQSDLDDDVFELGPLGDPSLGMKRILNFKSHFSHWFPVNEICSSRRKISISTLRGENGEISEAFNILKSVFLGGTDPELLFSDEALLAKIGRQPTMFYFLKEISMMRQFWILVNSEVSKNS